MPHEPGLHLEFEPDSIARTQRAVGIVRDAIDRYPETEPVLLQLLYQRGDPHQPMRAGLIDVWSRAAVRGGVLRMLVETTERFDWILAHAAAGDVQRLRELLPSCDDPPPPL
jgi:hypothetical protein